MARVKAKHLILNVSTAGVLLASGLLPAVPALAQSSSTDDTAQFNNEQLPQGVRQALLKLLVNRSIKQDEAQQVLTGVTITDLQSQRTLVGHNQDTEQFAASINKLPVALLVLQELRAHHVTLDQTISWLASDVRGGNGVYDQPGAPLQATWHDVLFDMLNRSGNTVVRVAVNYMLGGAAAVNARWATVPELSHTYLIPLDSSRFYLGNSTPRDALWALEQLMVQPDQYSNFMKQALATNIYTDIGTRSQLAGNDYIVLVNKIGLLDDPDGNNRHDVGIIYNVRTHKSYGYSFFTTAPYNTADPAATTQAEQSLKDMGGVTLRYAGDRSQPHHDQQHALQGLIPEHKVLY